MLVVLGDFELQVNIQSFSNPDGRCADDDRGACTAERCCEGGLCPNSCSYFFSLCLRPAGTPVSMVRAEGQGDCSANTVTTGTSELLRNGTSFTDSIFGTPNPITLNTTLVHVNYPEKHVHGYLFIVVAFSATH